MNNSFLDKKPESEIDSLQGDREKAVDDYQISLLEEKLVVKRQRQKVGQVVVRKEVETRMVHIPIRRETLIVEEVGLTTERVTEVDLGEEQINGVKFNELGDSENIYQTQSNFVPLQTAKELLAEIPNRSDLENVRVRVEIITDNAQSQTDYQAICDRKANSSGNRAS